MKKKIKVILAVALVMSSVCVSFASMQFSDIEITNWAYQYVNKLVEKGGIKGYPDGTFKPQNTMTAAEFVKTIVALIDGEKEPLENDKHWASGYMNVAVNVLQIVPEGMFERSDWNKPITRQKMGVIMEKTAQLFYEEQTVTDEAKLKSIQASIKDYDSICKYCKNYIVQAVARGLINGYSDGTFKPEKTATRAEAATMIVRLIEPAYRTTEVKTDVVKEGTNLTDILPADVVNKADGDFMTKYVVLKNGDKFHLKYLYSNDKNFYVEYKFYGNVWTLDKNKQIIDVSDPTNDWGTLLTQAFNGNLKDTAYFIFEDAHEWTAYLVPNTLTE